MIVELTASRALVHYEGWASRWDEWLQLDSGRIVKRGESGEKDGAAGKDGDGSGKRRSKNVLSGSGDGADDVEWSYSRADGAALAAASTAANSGAPLGWLSHTALNSAKLEQAYQALLSSSPSLALTSSSSSSPSPVTLRAGRQSFDVQLLSMTQTDALTGASFFLKRKSASESNSFTFLEDVQCAITGEQLLCVLPGACPPNLSARPVVRVFSMGKEAAWRGDVRLLHERNTSMPAGLSAAYTHPSQHHEPQLSSVCYDALNDELNTYYISEDTLRRWRNIGPCQRQSIALAERFDALEEEEAPRDDDGPSDACSDDSSDDAVVPPAEASAASSALRLAAALLADVSACYRLHLSPSSSSLVEPFCIDAHAATFASLHRLIAHCWEQLHDSAAPSSSPSTSPATPQLGLSILVSLLRLLQANLVRLPRLPTEPSLSLAVQQLRELLLELSCSSSPPPLAASSWALVLQLCYDCLVTALHRFLPLTRGCVPRIERTPRRWSGNCKWTSRSAARCPLRLVSHPGSAARLAPVGAVLSAVHSLLLLRPAGPQRHRHSVGR